jgi:cytochrome c-type biogenesis protein CcmF
MTSEIGTFFLAMALGFASVQMLASFWGVVKNNFSYKVCHPEEPRRGELRISFNPQDPKSPSLCEGSQDDSSKYLFLGRIAAFLQGGFLGAAFLTLIIAFLSCDFSLLVVTLHDHTRLPWYYRFAATWGHHEGSLLLFVLILSAIGMAQATFLHTPLFRARTLIIQGSLTALFLVFLMLTSNPFTTLPFSFPEGKSLNPLLQDRGLLMHPPLLYLGYVGFSAPFSLAMAALWGETDGKEWGSLTRPWVLFAWGSLTAGIVLGSWWAYYELGWGGWWFWDPVENASLMPWLAGTALLHTLRSGTLYRWSLFLSLLTFILSLLGTFLVRSGLIISVHSFAQDPERGIFILSLLSSIAGFSFFMWAWKAPALQSPPLSLFSRQGALLLNSLLLCMGLSILLLGTLYPLWNDFMGGSKIAIGAPYFERTFIPLMVPLLAFIPIGSLLGETKSLFSLLLFPLTIALGAAAVLLYLLHPPSLWAFTGIVMAVWVMGGTLVAFTQKHLSLSATLAHLGVGISLLGVSVGGGFRTDETRILGVQESFDIGGKTFTLKEVQHGKETTYLYEKAILTYSGGVLIPEKRLYLPQNSLLSETAIYTNGFKDIYVILGPYQGNNRWLIRASSIPLAPWIWAGGVFMVLGALLSFLNLKIPELLRRYPPRRKQRQLFHVKQSIMGICLICLFLPFASFAESALEKRANAFNKEVRCPVCLGQSIADSETEEANALKKFVFKKLQEGDSEEIIREKLRSLYGDEILFHPPFKTNTLLLWLAPFGFFLFLLGGILWKGVRTRTKNKENIKF